MISYNCIYFSSLLHVEGDSTSQSSSSFYSARQSVHDSGDLAGNQSNNDQISNNFFCKLSSSLENDDDFYTRRHSIMIEFLQSLWFAFISNTDLICYLLVFVNMVASQSLLALPMPFMVFLWGTLIVPRPSKTFWITLIAYTEVNDGTLEYKK